MLIRFYGFEFYFHLAKYKPAILKAGNVCLIRFLYLVILFFIKFHKKYQYRTTIGYCKCRNRRLLKVIFDVSNQTTNCHMNQVSNQPGVSNRQRQLSQPLAYSVISSNNTATCQLRTNKRYCTRSNCQCPLSSISLTLKN